MITLSSQLAGCKQAAKHSPSMKIQGRLLGESDDFHCLISQTAKGNTLPSLSPRVFSVSRDPLAGLIPLTGGRVSSEWPWVLCRLAH